MTAPVEILIHVTGLAAARVCAKHALKPRGMSRQGRSARALSGRMPPACADGPAPRPWRARASAFDLPAEQGGQAVVDRPGLPAEIVQPLKLREMVLLKLAPPFV